MTKNCPNCYETIPEFTNRCKHCFEDLSPKKKNSIKLPVLMPLVFLGLSVVALLWTQYLSTNQAFRKHVFDYETESILKIEKTGEGITADRISFEDVSTFEYIIGGEYAKYEIVAITKTSERIIIQSSPEPLKRDADELAESLGTSVTTVHKTRGNLD